MSLSPARRMRGVERTLIRQIFDSAPADAIHLGLGQPDLPTPTSVALAGIEAIAEGRTSYGPTAGDPVLRAAVARSYAPFAQGPQNVLITVGTQEALFVACLVLLDPGDELLYPDPGYPAYAVVARLLGAKPVSYPLDPRRGFRVEARDVTERVTGSTRAVILCSPSNPTGAIAEETELRRLVGELERRGVAWISDEVYAGFVYERELVSPWRFSSAGGLVISGLSKDASMTGWRVGWIVGAEEIVARITAAHQYVVTCASSVSQAAACAALAPAGIGERRAYLDLFRARRARMGSELARIEGLDVVPPDGAFYYFVDVRPFGSSLEIARRLLERQRVVTVPGEAFGPGGAGWLRLSFACSEERIREGVRRLELGLRSS